MNGTLEIWDVTTLNLPPAQWIKTSSVTFASEMETANPTKIKKLTITVTPVNASNPGSIVHVFERVTELLTPQSTVELEGVQYKRTSQDGEVETLKFLNLGVDGRTADGGMAGTFRVVHPNGEKETMTTVPGTYTWQPSSGALNGGSFLADPPLREQHEVVAAGSSVSRQTDRIYRKIGSQSRNELALASETTTTAGHVETTLFGYDERVTLAWFQENKEFGRERWQSRTDGTWSLNLLVELEEPFSGRIYFAEEVNFTPWLDQHAHTPNPSNWQASKVFFDSLITQANTGRNYVIAGCRRVLIADAQKQTSLPYFWDRRLETSIGAQKLGVEYEYRRNEGGSISFDYKGGPKSLQLKSRVEKWNAAAASASSTLTDWQQPGAVGSCTMIYDNAASVASGGVKLELSVPPTVQTFAQLTERAPSGTGSIVSTRRFMVNPEVYEGKRRPKQINLGSTFDYQLSTRQEMDDQGREVSESTLYNDWSPQARRIIQTIETAYHGDTGYTRTLKGQNEEEADKQLDSQEEDTVTTENSILVRTSTRTDEQGITIVTKTNEDTGEMISQTRKGVDATAEFPAQLDVITSYTKSTDATTGEVAQTVTQSAGTATRTLSVTVTDALGRTKSVTDEIGRVTSYAYRADGRQTTEFLPGHTPANPVTRITTTYGDGQLKSITGTAVVPEFHEYTVNDGSNANYEAGSITETVWTGWDGTAVALAEAVWRKTTTNFFGRVLREEQASPAPSGGTIATVHFYDDYNVVGVGLLYKSETTGLTPLYVRDTYQFKTRAYLVNESSWDYVGSSLFTYFVELASYTQVWARTSDSLGPRGVDQPVLLRNLRDAGGTWQQTFEGNGRRMEHRTEHDALTHMRWEGSATSLGENWKSSARTFYNGLLMREVLDGKRRTYQYDGFGRVTQVVDTSLTPPTTSNPVQTTTTTYNHTGGLLTSESVSGTGTRAFSRDARTYTYYPVGHVNAGQVETMTQGGHVARYAYDLQGRQTHQWGDAVQPMRYEYDGLGRLWKLHTYQDGTGWNSETLPDNFTTATPATTTWTYRPGTNALWKKTDALSRSVTYTYDASGLLRTKTNARGTIATYSYAQTPSGKRIPGRVSSITYDDGITPPVSFVYHTNGSLKTVTDAAGTQGINLSASSVLARNIVISGNGLLNGVILNRTHFDEDHPQTLQLRLAGQPILPDAGGSLSYNNPVTVFTHAYSWDMGTYPHLMGVGSTAGTGLTKQTSTSVSYDYLNGLPRHRYVQGMNYQTSYRYMPDGAVMEIATQTRRYNYGGKMVGRGGMADEWYYEFDSRGRRKNMLWTDMYEPDFQDRHPKRWIYDYNDRGEVEQADREGQFLTENGWETAAVTHQRRNYTFDLMGNRDTAIQGTSTAEKAAFTQDYTPNALQQYSTVARGRVVEITGEAAEGAVVALRIDEGTPFNVDRTLPENQTGDYNSFRYLHTVTGTDARWVKVEFTVTLGAAVTLRRGFVYVPPANEAPQHDLDGNLTDDGRWVYTWDAENRLISMTQKVIPVAAGVSTPPARTRLEFAYDYKNRRIAKKVFVEESGTGVMPH